MLLERLTLPNFLDDQPQNIETAIVDNKPPSTGSENRPEPKRKSSKVAQLEKQLSIEGYQHKPGPSEVAKKRKMADDEEISDVEQTIINDSPSTSDGNKPRAPIKALALQCTEPNCVEMVSDLGALHDHIANHHGLPPFRCLAPGCNQRFDIK